LLFKLCFDVFGFHLTKYKHNFRSSPTLYYRWLYVRYLTSFTRKQPRQQGPISVYVREREREGGKEEEEEEEGGEEREERERKFWNNRSNHLICFHAKKSPAFFLSPLCRLGPF
jgi:hypothetical protein